LVSHNYCPSNLNFVLGSTTGYIFSFTEVSPGVFRAASAKLHNAPINAVSCGLADSDVYVSGDDSGAVAVWRGVDLRRMHEIPPNG